MDGKKTASAQLPDDLAEKYLPIALRILNLPGDTKLWHDESGPQIVVRDDVESVDGPALSFVISTGAKYQVSLALIESAVNPGSRRKPAAKKGGQVGKKADRAKADKAEADSSGKDSIPF